MTHEQSTTALAVSGFLFGDVDGLPATVIPAAAGTTALLITCEIGAARPQLRDLRVTYPDVLGWRFTSDHVGAEPVFAFDPFARPDRRVAEAFVRDGSLFRGQSDDAPATLAEVKARVLRRSCQAWDEHQHLTAYLGALAARRRQAPAVLELVAA